MIEEQSSLWTWRLCELTIACYDPCCAVLCVCIVAANTGAALEGIVGSNHWGNYRGLP